MPTFFVFEGIKICLFFNDHNPPHFHAFYAEDEILVNINKLEVMEGAFPKRQLKKVIKFASENQAILMEIWNSLKD